MDIASSPPMTAALVEQALSTHPAIELAILFGSQASGSACADSDVDVAVLASRPVDAAQKMTIVADLAAATGRPVDLVDIRTAGEPLLGQIVTRGVRLRGSAAAQAQWLYRSRYGYTVWPRYSLLTARS